jgi:hypothetical protein
MAMVRYKMKKHVCGELHDWCNVAADEARKVEASQLNIGQNIGKIVLSNIKEHDSDASYERRITTAEAMGLNVGTKNHSRKFMPKLRESMHAVLIGSFTAVLTKPDPATKRLRPFAPIADKATVNRTTGQMTGLITMMEGELRAVFTATLLASEGTGAGLAALLWDNLHNGQPFNLSPTVVTLSMTGFAGDGQYQGKHEGHACGLDVISHFCPIVPLNPKWVISRWDGAHRIELGMDTVRKQTDWYGKLAGVVSSAQTKYLYGKGHERVTQAAAALGNKLAAIGVVCDTRFCQSERKVCPRPVAHCSVAGCSPLVSQQAPTPVRLLPPDRSTRTMQPTSTTS